MAPSSTPWDELKIEELKRLWAQGYSARDIAHELGAEFTRCGVLGKINRLGLSRRKPEQQRKPREFSVKRGRPIVRRPVFTAPQTPPQPPQIPQPPPEPAKPRMRRLQLMALQEHHCRWGIGDPVKRPFYFCAADTAEGKVYCEFHFRKSRAKRGC